MHVDEVDTDVELVRRLVASQFPEWGHLPIEPVRPLGTDNALYRLGQDLVVRLPRTVRTGGALKKEREWLPRLAPLLPLAVPFPLAEGMPAEGYPFEWSIYRWLEGGSATRAQLADLGRTAAAVAGFVEALHRVDPTGGPPPGEHNAFRGAPLETRDESTRAAIASLDTAIDVRTATAAWDAALAAPEWTRPPVWIHGDLDARNMLVRQGRLSAVIDFGCLGVGDPACDVAVAWKMFSAPTRDVFRAALESTRRRGHGHAAGRSPRRSARCPTTRWRRIRRLSGRPAAG